MPRDDFSTVMLNHTVGKIPGRLARIDLPAGSSVNDALRTAGLTGGEKGYNLTVNNRPANPDDTLNESASVLMTRAIKGN